MFENVEKYLGDPIFSLSHQFNLDPRSDKINLAVGLYQNEMGIVPQLQSIKKAKDRLIEWQRQASVYLPIEGLSAYRLATSQLLFGKDNLLLKTDRLATVQTVGGSGSLKVGAVFLKRYFPDSEVWLSDATWHNHYAIFNGTAFKVNTYPYFDKVNQKILFTDLCSTLACLPAKSIVLFHPCCHNPTGADLTEHQWDIVIKLIKQRNDLIPFFDIAYQGFGNGLVDDCYAIRKMADANLACLVSNSFSKIFSLYGERVGGLTVVCQDHDQKERVLGQLKAIIRCSYSNPPSYGARQVELVLNDPELFQLWSSELGGMRSRLIAMRRQFASALHTLLPDNDFSYLVNQRGMFSYTGLEQNQVSRLRQHFGIYLVDSGRMSIAGLNNKNIERVAYAIATVLKS